jgi:16S rRNA (adenine1518-N6/adenine1519-N6)-dimethyltransferase
MRYNDCAVAASGALTSPTRLRPLLERHGLWLRKRFGQHFLCDANILKKIVAAAEIEPGAAVLEIGAGIGTLTVALAETGARVVAVEVDHRLLPLLRENLADFDNVQVVHADILKTQPARMLASRRGAPPRAPGLGRPQRAAPTIVPRWKVVANLPYSITAPVLLHLLRQRPRPELMVLMVQKEVADRLLSPPGAKEYGSLAVLVQAFMEVERVAAVSQTCFFPAPKVESAIIRLRPRKKALVPLRLTAIFEQVLRASFGQRRKTLLNALSGSALGLSRPGAAAALEAAGIQPHLRAESLGIPEFVALARCVHQRLAEEQKTCAPSR